MQNINNNIGPVLSLTKFQKNETIRITANCFNYSNVNNIHTISFKCFKVVNETIFDITTDVVSNFKIVDPNVEIVSGTIKLPDENCILIYILNDIPDMIQVGSPDIYLYYYNNILESLYTNRNVSYKSYTPDGIFIESNNLSKITNGIISIYYYKLLSVNDYAILEIIDNIDGIPEITTAYYLPIDPKTYNQASSGVIKLQPNRFQMIAIPNPDKDIGYFLELVQNALTLNNSSLRVQDVILLTKAYPSTVDIFNKYQIYIPGSSGDSSKFSLMIQDNNVKEINPFFVKTGSFGNLDHLLIEWSS